MSPVPTDQRRILLTELPDGTLERRHFTHESGPVPTPAPGEILVRTILISIDPANRMWMNGETYRPQLETGEVMAGYALAEVVDANGTDHPAGSVVLVDAGWQEYASIAAAEAVPIPVQTALTHHLSVLGLTGLTAFFGLTRVGRPSAGETVVVSAAAGATGNVVGQLARIAGARVVGITSSDEKRRLLEDELGFDATVSHRSLSFDADLAAACPDGIDVYFDNVGGSILSACLRLANERGRVVCCGGVSSYDQDAPSCDHELVPLKVATHRLRLEGFLVLDFVPEWPAAGAELATHIAEGRLRVLEDVAEGLDAAPDALIGLLAGSNVGKRMVRVGPDPSPEGSTP
jgi:NADPH-dependent curcumin reductase CurA